MGGEDACGARKTLAGGAVRAVGAKDGAAEDTLLVTDDVPVLARKDPVVRQAGGVSNVKTCAVVDSARAD